MLNYPIAQTAKDALQPESATAMTQPDAKRQTGDESVELVTEWLSKADLGDDVFSTVSEYALGAGFGQVYQALDGKPTLAVSYWKIPDTITLPSSNATPTLAVEKPIRSVLKKAKPPPEIVNQLELF